MHDAQFEFSPIGLCRFVRSSSATCVTHPYLSAPCTPRVLGILSAEFLLFGGEDANGMDLASQPVIGLDQFDLH